MFSMFFSGEDDFSVRKLKRSVREEALARQPRILGSSRGSQSDSSSEHMLTPQPHPMRRYPQLAAEDRSSDMMSPHSFDAQFTNSLLKKQDGDELLFYLDTVQDFDDFNEIHDDDSPNHAATSSLKSLSVMEDPLGEDFFPTLLTDSPLLDDLYEDLLGKYLPFSPFLCDYDH